MSHHQQRPFTIPPTIDSSHGSLHSESLHDDEPFRDDTEGGLMSASMPNANEDIVSKRDKKFDKKWRGIVSFVLLANALVITGSTYGFLASQEKKDFDAKVRLYSTILTTLYPYLYPYLYL